MTPFAGALIDFGHVLGAVLMLGGAIHSSLVVLPAARKIGDDRQKLIGAMRWRARSLALAGMALLAVTGLFKWIPDLGGVGWLGGEGLYTAMLHGKIVLALIVFHLALELTSKPRDEASAARRPRLARLAALLGLVIVFLGVMHQSGALE